MADFERFIFADWSANAKPKTGKDSIWVASCTRENIQNISNGKFCDNLSPYKKENNNISNREKFLKFSSVVDFSTRGEILDFLKEILEQDHGKNKKTLIGFDFGFGYPHRVYKNDEIGKTWCALWKNLCDDICDEDYKHYKNCKKEYPYPHYKLASRWNEEHELCFWGKNSKQKKYIAPHVSSKKDEAKLRMYGKNDEEGLGEFRITDERVRWSGVKSQWQLYGAGSVGSQSLLGIPYAYALRKHLNKNKIKTKVWPFETEFADKLEDFGVLMCEVHFAAICRVQERIARKIDALQCQSKSSELPKNYPRDKIQVEEMCRFFAEEDEDEIFLQKFLKVDCSCVSKDDKDTAQKTEGWILGAPLCLQTSEHCDTCKNKNKQKTTHS